MAMKFWKLLYVQGFEASLHEQIPLVYQKLVKGTIGKFVSFEDTDTSINIIREIQEKATPDDFVVVKMDIEGHEWQLIPKMLETGVFQNLIDEFMVEIHFKHHKLAYHGWNMYWDHTVFDAAMLLQQLRDVGVVAHYWP